MRGHTEDIEPARHGVSPSTAEDRDDRPLVPTIARWPLDVDAGFDRLPLQDPWQALVRDSMIAYREGRTDVASWSWTRDIVWRVAANGFSEEHRGPDAVFAYHQRLARLTGGTFRQRVVALQASRGPIVEAHLHSTAQRGSARLDMPTLVVFELAAGRIRLVTEMPGDPVAWGGFWR